MYLSQPNTCNYLYFHCQWLMRCLRTNSKQGLKDINESAASTHILTASTQIAANIKVMVIAANTKVMVIAANIKVMVIAANTKVMVIAANTKVMVIEVTNVIGRIFRWLSEIMKKITKYLTGNTDPNKVLLYQ